MYNTKELYRHTNNLFFVFCYLFLFSGGFMFGKIKIALVLAIAVLAASVVGVTVYAEGEEPLVGYTVYDSDMAEKSELSGSDWTALNQALPLLADGDTIVLNSDIRMTSTFYLSSAEDAPREINLDLAGNRLYAFEKMNMIWVNNYTTLNVYSSLPGAEIYSTNVADIGYAGNIYTIGGASAVINSGKFTVGDVTYPGENLTTYSSCLVDLITTGDGGNLCDENCALNIDGGNYFSIIYDYTGFVIPRCGKATINIRRANLIMMDNRELINSLGPETLLNIEDCVILQANGTSKNLFNNATGKVTLKNCISNFRLAVSSAATDGVVELVGRNVFAPAESASMAFLNTDEPLTEVTTSAEYELYGGGKTVRYLDGYSNWNYLEKIMYNLESPIRYVAEEDVQKYTFKKDKQSVTQFWAKDEQPYFPYTVPSSKEEGVYRYAWQMRYGEDGGIIYTVERIYDGPLLVSVSEDDELLFNIYFPARFDEEGILNYSGAKIDGSFSSKGDWERVTVDGEEYIRTSFAVDTTDLEREIEIVIPMYFNSGINVETIWRISLRGYIDRVLATESEGIYTAEEYEFVHGLNAYFE